MSDNAVQLFSNPVLRIVTTPALLSDSVDANRMNKTFGHLCALVEWMSLFLRKNIRRRFVLLTLYKTLTAWFP